jgi:hypothetical protein
VRPQRQELLHLLEPVGLVEVAGHSPAW